MQLTIGQLKQAIASFPDDLPVYFRRISPIAGNVEEAGSIQQGAVGFFGRELPCAIIEPMADEG